MSRRGPGPHTAWVGVVIKLTDGTTHALEFVAGVDNVVFADIVLPSRHFPNRPSIVKIEGKGRYWTEGADLGPDIEQPKALEQGQRAIEGEVL